MASTENTTKAPGTCSCNTRPDGTEGQCNGTTKKSFAQGHDARMSSRIATAIASGRLTMGEGLALIHKAGGGPALVSKTQWSVALRAKKLAAKKGGKGGRSKKCAECGTNPIDTTTQGKDSTLCTACHEFAGEENRHSDDAHETTGLVADCPVCAQIMDGTDEEPETVTIKLGRWTYPATIASNGDATYTNRRGEEMSAVAGSFSVVK